LTTQQRQQQAQSTPPPSVSLRAQQALSLYAECAGTGQWARVVIEQRPSGEHVTFFSRPMAAAATAARGQSNQPKRKRHPNKKRVERALVRSQSRKLAAAGNGQQQQQQQTQAGFAERQQQQRQQDTSSSQQLGRSPVRMTLGLTSAAVPNSTTSRKQQPSVAATTAGGSYAAAVVSTARAATATVEVVASPTASNSPAISPKLTRARKKLRTMSEAFNQLDGSACSPPPSPEALDQSGPASPEGLSLPAGCLSQPAGSLRVPALAPPPPPPPWSKFLPDYPKAVICKVCLAASHGIRFNTCHDCYDKSVKK